MKWLGGVLAALTAHFLLQSIHVWWVLASARPLLFVVLAAVRTGDPVRIGWVGLGVGLLEDVLADRVIGPGGIAGAVAGLASAMVARRFELEGPLFWIVGSLVVTSTSETAWHIIQGSLGQPGDHGWLGSLAALGTTAALAMVLAAIEHIWLAWRSPIRRRRRKLLGS